NPPPPIASSDRPGAGPDGSVIANPATRAGAEPVAEPGALLGYGRLRSAGGLVDTVASYAGLPSGLLKSAKREAVQGLLEEFSSGIYDPAALAELVDVEAPIDFVIVADLDKPGPFPKPMAAFSVGLTSFDGAVETSRDKPRPLGPGVTAIGEESEFGDGCAISVAAGRAPARLVCVEEQKNLEVMAPYVARNVAARPDNERDLHIELNFRPLFEKYGTKWSNQIRGLPLMGVGELKQGNATFDDALADMFEGLAKEGQVLITDLDAFALDLSLKKGRGIDVGVELKLRDKQSWVAAGLQEAADKADTPSSMFWQLPKSSLVATFGRAGTDAHSADIVDVLTRLAEGGLELLKVGTGGDRAAIAKTIRSPWGDKVKMVSASGSFPGKVANIDPDDPFDSLLGGGLTWYLFGLEEPSGTLTTWLKDLAAAYSRPTLQGFLRKEMKGDAKYLPVVRALPGPFGRGSLDLVMRMTTPPMPPTKGPRKLEIHVLVMEDAGKTWAAFGADKAALTKLLGSLKGGKAGADSLGSLPGLARLKGERHTSGSVSSLQAFIDSMMPILESTLTAASSLGGAGSAPNQQLEIVKKILAKLPHQGMSPIISFGEAKGGPAPNMTMTFNVPDETLEDIGYLGKNVFMQFSGKGAP
ncbi:MAG: hypothetical protein AAGA56_27545, partial [Myxococcota bacterium]